MTIYTLFLGDIPKVHRCRNEILIGGALVWKGMAKCVSAKILSDHTH